VSAASFDSNILIDALKNREEAWHALEQVDDRWISRVTWIEVMSKVDQRNAAATRAMVDSFYLDEMTPVIAERAAALRNARRLGLPDAVILASAQVNGRILITRNTKAFPADMPGIRVPYTL
jgi:predicted nucleic acid-binding protein